MHVLFLFLDGIGLGEANPEINPFASASMPYLDSLLGGRKLVAGSAPHEGPRASLTALDPNLGVDGLPQSATGQAALLTGRNIPAEVGCHYGPKPDPAVAATLTDGGIFGRLQRAGYRSALLNAYPPRYFDGIDSGKRLYSSIPLAVTNAGLRLFTHEDLEAGRALSADFTGQAWHDFLGFTDTPILQPEAAGARLASLSRGFDFSFFEYWSTDYAGHKQDMEWAVRQLELFDRVLKGLLDDWDDSQGLVLLTSDHGNMEDLSVRRHTANPVPLLLIGSPEARAHFRSASDLTGLAPAIWNIISGDELHEGPVAQ